MVEVIPYHIGLAKDWDWLVEHSANGTFIHQRSFMEYHEDKFDDLSLLIYEDGVVKAVFPAHREKKQIYSHQGLSFGGWLFKKGTTEEIKHEIILESLEFYKNNGFEKISVKPVPTIYHAEKLIPTQLFQRLDFKEKGDTNTYVIPLPHRVKNKGKVSGAKKAVRSNIRIETGDSFARFWTELLQPLYLQKLNLNPAHQVDEIKKLAFVFPRHISQMNAYLGDELLAGITIFRFQNVIKTQYIASNEKGRALRAVDYLIKILIEDSEAAFLDLGGVKDPHTGEEKEGLVFWKESVGAYPIAIKTFEKELN